MPRTNAAAVKLPLVPNVGFLGSADIAGKLCCEVKAGRSRSAPIAHRHRAINTTRFLAVLLGTALLARADVLPPVQDTSSAKGKLTAASGKATTLAVSATSKAFVLFNLNSLPVDVRPADIANARLRVYFPTVSKPGDINIHTVSPVGTLWNETTAALEPGVSGTSVATFPAATVMTKRFVEVDVTPTVQAWRAGTAANFGFAFVANGITKVTLGAKEGAGSGYPAELEVQIDRTTVSIVGGVTAANVATGANLALAATSANTASAIVKRDASGNFSAGRVTATAFIGDGSQLTGVAIAAEPPANVIPVLGMVWIKPGTFIMGSPASDPDSDGTRERPQTVVTLTKAFWMGSHEVTQGEHVAVIGSNPSQFTGNSNRPVEYVSWNDAVAYCAALTTTERMAGRLPATWGYRLPTEAEWEYACRAGARTTRFGYGDDLSGAGLTNYAWIVGNSSSTTHPVEQKLGNPWGLMDMHGNVYEWCQDYFGTYPGGSVTDPQGPNSGSYRVFRGGGWSVSPATCRSAQRDYYDPPFVSPSVGFRVVLSPGQP